MKKHIDKDLLKILKSKRNDELFYTILNMGNGTYKYEIDYLNKVNLELIRIYLEKIILIASNKKKLVKYEDYMNGIFSLCDNIDLINVNELNRHLFVNIETILKIRNLNSTKKDFKHKVVDISAFALATIIFF